MPLCLPSASSAAYAKMAWTTLASSPHASLQQRRVSKVSRHLSSLVSRSGGPLFRVVLTNNAVVARADTAEEAWKDWRLFQAAVEKQLPPGLESKAESAAFLADRVHAIVSKPPQRREIPPSQPAAEAYAAAAGYPGSDDEAKRQGGGGGLSPEEEEAVRAAHQEDEEWLLHDASAPSSGSSSLAPLLAEDDTVRGRLFPVPLARIPTEERWAVAGLLATLASAQARRQAGDRSELMWAEFSRQTTRCLGLADDDPDGSRRGAMALLMSSRSGPSPDPSPFLDGIRNRGLALAVSAELAVLAFGGLDSRAQELLREEARLLGASWSDVLRLENLLADRMQLELEEESRLTEGGREKAATSRSVAEMLKVGGLAAGGAFLMAVTGGLAAPAIGAAATSLGFASAAVLGTAHGMLAAATIFGAAGGGLTGYKASRRYADVTEFAFEELSAGDAHAGAGDEDADGGGGVPLLGRGGGPMERHLPVVLAINGFLTRPPRPHAPWAGLDQTHAPDSDVYVVRWESEDLADLGAALESFVGSAVKSYAAREVAMRTIVGGMMAAAAWPVTVLSAATMVDNPFGVVLNKAHKAAPALADALSTRAHGRRPVTIAAVGMGALMAFLALEELARRQEALDREDEPGNELRGIVHDVVLLGAPVDADPARWERVSTVVAGRLVNGFSYADWLLRFAHRAHTGPSGRVAGLAPVKSKSVENYDLSQIVQGHLQYASRVSDIFDEIGFCPGYRSRPLVPVAEAG